MMASVTKEVATVGTNEKRLFELERELTMAIISGKYKATILWNLEGPNAIWRNSKNFRKY